MKTTALAVTGSLLINLILGFAVAALFSVASPAHGAQPEAPSACPHATRIEAPPTRSAVTPAGHSNYVTAARMGWAIG